ncbi:MAG: HU family DNA-binding protein [Desulfobacteraceae bacterium]|jgi:nucleoid DNA-binding protein
MNKTDLINSVRDNVHLERKTIERQQFLFPELNVDFFPKKKAKNIVNSLIEIMKKRLEKGDNVYIHGFGRFDVIFKWARKGHNPKTGEKIFINSKRTVKFKSFKKLKERVNGSKPHSP